MIDTAQLRRLIEQTDSEIIDGHFLAADALLQLAQAIYRAGQADSASEIQRLQSLSNGAEKWKGIASAKFGDGRTVQRIEEEARQDAYRNVLSEWEKPWGLSGGKSFIDRLRAMAKL